MRKVKTKFTILGSDGFEQPTKCCKMVMYGDDVKTENDPTYKTLIEDSPFVVIQLGLNNYIIARKMTGPVYEKCSDYLPSIGIAMRQLEDKKNVRRLDRRSESPKDKTELS